MAEIVQPRPEAPVIPEPPAEVTQVIRAKVIPLVDAWAREMTGLDRADRQQKRIAEEHRNKFSRGHQRGLERSSYEIDYLLDVLEQWLDRPDVHEIGRVETEDGDFKVMLRQSLPRVKPSVETKVELSEHRWKVLQRDINPTPSPDFLAFWVKPTFEDRPALLIFTERVAGEELGILKGQREPRYGVLLLQSSGRVEGRGVSFSGERAHVAADKVESDISADELGLLMNFVKEMWRQLGAS